MYIKTQSYITHIQVFKVMSFSFVNQPSLDLFPIKTGQNLYMCFIRLF